MTPVEDNACKMPTIADELCIMTVKISPVKIPKIGMSLKYESTLINTSESASGSTADVIDIKPVNNTPKPSAMVPAFFVCSFLINIISTIPIINAIGASVSGLKKLRMDPSDDSISIKRIICAVTVVPILAPKTILTACLRFRTPAPIRPTVRTIVAVEL